MTLKSLVQVTDEDRQQVAQLQRQVDEKQALLASVKADAEALSQTVLDIEGELENVGGAAMKEAKEHVATIKGVRKPVNRTLTSRVRITIFFYKIVFFF